MTKPRARHRVRQRDGLAMFEKLAGFVYANRRRVLINPDGGRLSYTFSLRDQCVGIVNPEGDRTSWTFDHAGRQTVQLRDMSYTDLQELAKTSTLAAIRSEVRLRTRIDLLGRLAEQPGHLLHHHVMY